MCAEYELTAKLEIIAEHYANLQKRETAEHIIDGDMGHNVSRNVTFDLLQRQGIIAAIIRLLCFDGGFVQDVV